MEFNYDSIQWETGDNSGGSSNLGGTSGFVGGSTGSNSISLVMQRSGSGTPGTFLDSNSTTGLTHNMVNSGGVLGRYDYIIRPTSTVALTNPGNHSNLEGDAVSLALQASDFSNSSISYSATGLPGGLSIYSATGVISGTLSAGDAASSPDSVAVVATDGTRSDTQTFNWYVSNPVFTWTNNPTGNPTISVVGSQTSAEGDSISLNVIAADSYTMTYSAVNLPLGLTINSGTGHISGTVDYQAAEFLSGSYSPTVFVTDTQGGGAGVHFNWTITDTPRVPTLTNPGSQSNAGSDSVSLQLTASQPDSDPLYYDATNLPSGLSIDENGLISGIIDPAAASATAYSVTVTVTDYQPATPQTASQTFNWTIAAGAASPSFTNPGAQSNAAGDFVDLTFDGSDLGGYPLTFTAAGLPSGLSIDPNSGEITGTLPNAAASSSPYSVTVRASDGQASAAQTFNWTVHAVNLTNPGDQANLASGSASLALTATDASSITLTYGASGLPSGLSLNSTTGVISGTLGGTGVATVTVTASDGSDSAAQSFLWEVDRLTLTNPGNLSNREGSSVSVTLGAIDHAGTPTFSVSGLPSGLSLNAATGVITGTIGVSAHGQSPYQVTAVANDGAGSDTQSFVWSVAPQIALFSPGPHGDASGDSISFAVTASDASSGTPTFSASGLPTGLSINSTTGIISGTVGTGAISSTPHLVTLTAADGTYSSSQTFSWSVSKIYLATPTDGASLDDDTVSLSLAATYHGSGTLGYSTSGLPEGLSLNATTGLVSGTINDNADVDGPYSPVVTITDGTDTTTVAFNWTVAPRVSVYGPGDETNVTGDSITLTVSAVEASSDSVTWTYSASGLPTGLSINSGTGAITGTITQSPSGSSDTVTVAASDGTSSVSTTFNYSIVPLILSNPGDQASVGSTSVSLALQTDVASGYTASYSATGLPSGLSINSSTGVISGTLSGGDTGHTYRVLVTATASGISCAQEFAWRVDTVVVTPPVDQTKTEGDSVSLTVSASTVSGTLSYSAVGLPAGLSINSSTGVISGTLAVGSTGSYSAIVSASNGTVADSQAFSWTVNPKVMVTEVDDQLNVEGDSASIAIGASEGGATLGYIATGLPTGLSINSATGVITGTVATGDAAHGPYEVDVTVSDGTYSSDVFFGWTIHHGSNHAPVLTAPASQANVVGDNVNLAVSVSDADSDTITFSADGLPDGLSIDSSSGVISGTMAEDALQSAAYSVTVTADDGNGGSASTTFSWIVNDSVLTTSASTWSATEGADTGSVTFGTFTTTDPNWGAGAFTATINWGDGSTDGGLIAGLNGSFTVVGEHVYDHPGTYAPQISVTDGFATAVATGSATVSAAALTVTGGIKQGVVAGTGVSGLWAKFHDANTNDYADSYTAVINWGDGSATTTGTITGSGGDFLVTGSHTFAAAGTDTVTVTILDQDGTTSSATSTAQVGNAYAGVNATLSVATFASSDTTSSAGSYSATIAWGDGTSGSGTVTGGSGVFTVQGNHTYSVDSLDESGGMYSVSVTLNGPSSETLTATKGVSVVRPPITGFTSDVLAGTDGALNSVQVLTFMEPDVSDTTSEFAATINWGDGSATTTGTVSGAAGLFHVSGSHTYTTAGVFPIQVTLSQGWSTFIPVSVFNALGRFVQKTLDAKYATDDKTKGPLAFVKNSVTLSGEAKDAKGKPLVFSSETEEGNRAPGNSWLLDTPLVYKRGSTLEVAATFTKSDAAFTGNAEIVGKVKVLVSGGPDNPVYATLGWTTKQTVTPQGNVYKVTAALADNWKFSMVGTFDLAIDWYMFDTTTKMYQAIGTTTPPKDRPKRIYVTFDTPKQAPILNKTTEHYPLTETFVALGSQQNSLAKTPEEVLKNTWDAFTGLTVTRATLQAGNPWPLVYWKGSDQAAVNKYKPEKSPATKLLNTPAGGPCYGFADLFVAALYAQGIVDAEGHLVGTKTAVTVVSIRSTDTDFTRLKVKETTLAQNNKMPPTIFKNHAVVRIGNVYYDPTYGVTYGMGINQKLDYEPATSLLLQAFYKEALVGICDPDGGLPNKIIKGIPLTEDIYN